MPVTADDVVASWSLMVDKGLQDPMTELVYVKYDKPVVESKYIVRVTSKVLNWRNFLYFAASMPILPAHVLKTVNGDRYVKDTTSSSCRARVRTSSTNRTSPRAALFLFGAGRTTGPRTSAGTSGSNNFDEIREIVVRDQKLAVEMFKRGDLDSFAPVNATFWVQEFGDSLAQIQRGLIQKRKVYNDNPVGTRGIRHQHAQGTLRRHPRTTGARASPESPAHRREAVLQRRGAYRFLLHGWHL